MLSIDLEAAKISNKAGHPLLLIGRRDEKIYELPLDFSNVLVSKVDVTDFDAFKSSGEKAEELCGETDLIINNAGVMLLGNVENQLPEEWKQMLDTNILGVLHGMQIVLSQMKKRKSGTIINVSSIAGRKTFGNHTAYSATKFGVHRLSETIREEVSHFNVRVSVVSPGAAETELLTHITDKKSISEYESWEETMGGKSLNPIYVAEVFKYIYDLPQEVLIREVALAATSQGV